MSELHLFEDERVIMDVSPTPLFKRYVIVKVAGTYVLPLLLVFNVMLSFVLYIGGGGRPFPEVGVGPLLMTYAVSFVVLALVVFALTFILVDPMYKRYHYWVTNYRVVWRHGVLGYKMRSVPLERISDVAVSRTFLETICGVGGIVIRRMTGFQYYEGARLGFPTMIAVPNPEEMQKQILELIRQKGKESKLIV